MKTHPDVQHIEKSRYALWLEKEAFKPQLDKNKTARAIMMPPPNVTGSLHMGHALNLTLQDMLARYWRMKGDDVLWQPGMDHAGIATQMVVERNLAKEGVRRQDLGRAAFVEKVWAWKKASGDTILDQQKRLGISPDWDRGRFTMDEGLSHAVRTVFVRLHEEGLIYRDEKLVNWDPKFHTAISDVEVENETRKGHFWYFRYTLVEDPSQHITIATTRPETLLGDVAVAVHPEDERYQAWIGKEVTLPLTGRTIPIIADEHSDPEKGTGAVKITPAHDFNDFEVGARHDLPRITIMDAAAHMAGDAVPEAYKGLSREEARKKIVADMEAQGFLEKIEDKEVTFPMGERSGVIIEPRLTKQWFVHMKPLAEKALKIVAKGETSFIPANWTKVYNDWLENIQPWCISRQLWWGHQIPIWYGPDETTFIAFSEEEALEKATAHYGKVVTLTQDPDVLDTWFSSALWPFSTLGWPEKTPELDHFYPTTTLVTGFDIIFFWVARMVMMGQHFTGQTPFQNVYIHALVLDEKGQKMSKSKGNVVDPLELINEHGADSLRFALGSQATPGRDIRFATSQVESARHFSTKLWNSARFYLNMRGEDFVLQPLEKPKHFVNQWILTTCDQLIDGVTDHMENFRHDLALQEVYQFAWTRFCDWYLELSKPLVNGDDEALRQECLQVMGHVLQVILKMLHPCMPFITEEIWSHLFGDAILDQTAWPVAQKKTVIPETATLLIDLVSAIRAARGEVNAPPSVKAPLYLIDQSTTALEPLLPFLGHLARVNGVETVSQEALAGKAMLQVVVAGKTYAIPLEGLIDIQAEIDRLKKNMAKAEKEIKGLEAKLSNQKFVANAPDAVIAKNKQRLAEETHFMEQSKQALARLV
ncbi:valine--tRNA ligase [Alphaproteobacteria bacterium]|nr:valine--tRNA ligase [Alphaproteobacteria bacterium]